MKYTNVLLIALVLVATCSAMTFKTHKLLEWVENGTPEPTDPIRLQFSLKMRNEDKLERLLLEVSNPESEFYGRYLTLDDLTELVGPEKANVNQVIQWLEDNDISDIKVVPTRTWLLAHTTVEKAERLLSTKIVYLKHVESEQIIMRAQHSYEIPSSLEHIAEFVAGLHTLPFSRIYPKVGERASGSVTPSTIYDLYDVTVPTGSCNCNTSQAVVEFGYLANYSPSDLQKFFQLYQPDLEGQVVEQIYSGNNNGDGFISTEANLDVQYIMALGAYVNTSDYVIQSSTDILEAFLDYTMLSNSQDDAPLVHSISYGEYGGSYDNSTVQKINTEFQMMGIRGITVSLASGDNGVGCGERCTEQEFDFPSSPYITMVGATGINNKGAENGASFSSGGFSRDYSQPSYQTQQVSAYLNSGVTLPTTSYDAAGRAYPDVSAVGVDLSVVVNGRSSGVDGTSCSAPIFAGIVALLNAQRDLQGKGPLGFINQWVYSQPQLWNDITSGDNSYQCCDGFEGAAGWDPVTGMGTPNYPALLQYTLSLPSPTPEELASGWWRDF